MRGKSLERGRPVARQAGIGAAGDVGNAAEVFVRRGAAAHPVAVAAALRGEAERHVARCKLGDEQVEPPLPLPDGGPVGGRPLGRVPLPRLLRPRLLAPCEELVAEGVERVRAEPLPLAGLLVLRVKVTPPIMPLGIHLPAEMLEVRQRATPPRPVRREHELDPACGIGAMRERAFGSLGAPCPLCIAGAGLAQMTIEGRFADARRLDDLPDGELAAFLHAYRLFECGRVGCRPPHAPSFGARLSHAVSYGSGSGAGSHLRQRAHMGEERVAGSRLYPFLERHEGRPCALDPSQRIEDSAHIGREQRQAGDDDGIRIGSACDDLIEEYPGACIRRHDVAAMLLEGPHGGIPFGIVAAPGISVDHRMPPFAFQLFYDARITLSKRRPLSRPRSQEDRQERGR